MAVKKLSERRTSMSNHDFRSILEKLTLLESDLTPTNPTGSMNKQQKSAKQLPALFKPKTQKILGGDPNEKNPMSGYAVGGCEESQEMEEDSVEDNNFGLTPVRGPDSVESKTELIPVRGQAVSLEETSKVKEEASEDVLTKVKNSFTDYLKSLEDDIKQDKDLIAKKKQDLDLKKKELKDLALQTKKKQELDEDYVQFEVGDRICVTGPNEYQGEFGDIVDLGRNSDFVIVDIDGEIVSMHASDVEFHDDQEDVEDWEEELDEDPTQENPGNQASAELHDPTYAECSSPVKTFDVGAENLLEIHGDESNGFEIRHGDRSLPTRFSKLDDAEMALNMFKSKRDAKRAQELNADYIEEK